MSSSSRLEGSTAAHDSHSVAATPSMSLGGCCSPPGDPWTPTPRWILAGHGPSPTCALGYAFHLHRYPEFCCLWAPASPASLSCPVSLLACAHGGRSLLSCFSPGDLQAAFCESVSHTSRHRLLGQAGLALPFHTNTLESRGTSRGASSVFQKSSMPDR